MPPALALSLLSLESVSPDPGEDKLRTPVPARLREKAALTGPGRRRAADVSLAQGLYYTGTGLWPIVSMRSFERVTGPKRDRWLVKTVGVLVSAIGITLARSGRRGRVHPDVALLGGLSAAALAAIDLVYVARRRISPVYLLDAVPEVMLAVWWGRRVARSRRAVWRAPVRGSQEEASDT